MSLTAVRASVAQALENYRPIPLVAFRIVDSLGINLYCLRENDEKPRLLCGERHTQTKEQLAEICDCEYETLLVSRQDFLHLSKKLASCLDRALADETIPLEERFSLLQIAYAAELEHLFRQAYLEKYYVLAQEVGKKISSLLQQGEVSVEKLFSLLHHNSCHYAHVTNVAGYAVVLARALEIASPEELDRIAEACLLCEVGNLYLPEGLLSQKGRLSPHEREELNRAPLLAYEVLCEKEGIDFSQLMMIYQRRERVDGTGYPVRILGEEIHPWAKLLSVVDAFDAVTSDRDYRPAAPLQEGLMYLTQNANTHFEPEMVLCWISAFQLQ